MYSNFVLSMLLFKMIFTCSDAFVPPLNSIWKGWGEKKKLFWVFLGLVLGHPQCNFSSIFVSNPLNFFFLPIFARSSYQTLPYTFLSAAECPFMNDYITTFCFCFISVVIQHLGGGTCQLCSICRGEKCKISIVLEKMIYMHYF